MKNAYLCIDFIATNMKINLFIPCNVDQYAPETGFRLLQLFELWNVEVSYNPQQPCCGKIFYDNGNFNEARELSQTLLRGFEPGSPIVTCSAACVSYVRTAMPELFRHSEQWSASKAFSNRFVLLEEWLFKENVADFSQVVFPHKVIVQSHCQSMRNLPSGRTMEKILKNVRDLIILDNPREDVCCGGGGFFPVRNESVAMEMAKNKMEILKESGVEYLVFNDFDCYRHMKHCAEVYPCAVEPILFSDLLHKMFFHE